MPYGRKKSRFAATTRSTAWMGLGVCSEIPKLETMILLEDGLNVLTVEGGPGLEARSVAAQRLCAIGYMGKQIPSS